MIFLEDDVKTMDEFGEFLLKHGGLTITIPEAIDFNRRMYNFDRLRKKLYEAVLEAKKPAPLPPSPEPPPAVAVAPAPVVAMKGRPKK